MKSILGNFANVPCEDHLTNASSVGSRGVEETYKRNNRELAIGEMHMGLALSDGWSAQTLLPQRQRFSMSFLFWTESNVDSLL